MAYCGRTELPMSVLDLSIGRDGFPLAASLRQTVDLARSCESAGYRRFWIGENHAVPGLAASAPAVLISAVAAATSRMRVGAGCVLLSNHAPLVVAEAFRTLAALYPERIDLGLGRSAGGDPVTVMALRQEQARSSKDDFLDRLAELYGFVDGFPAGHPLAGVRAFPDGVDLPDIWIFGTGPQSARSAALAGVGYGYACHLGYDLGRAGMSIAEYRRRFEPNGSIVAPRVLVSILVFCSDSGERAQAQANAYAMTTIRLPGVAAGHLPAPGRTAPHPLPPEFNELRDRILRPALIGTPDQVVDRLRAIMSELDLDELTLTSGVHDPVEHALVFELIAAEWERTS